MKKYLLIIWLVLIFTGCSTTEYSSNIEIKETSDDIYSLDKIKQYDKRMTELTQEIINDINDLEVRFNNMADKSEQIRLSLEAYGQDTTVLKQSEENIKKHINAMSEHNKETQEVLDKYEKIK